MNPKSLPKSSGSSWDGAAALPNAKDTEPSSAVAQLRQLSRETVTENFCSINMLDNYNGFIIKHVIDYLNSTLSIWFVCMSPKVSNILWTNVK